MPKCHGGADDPVTSTEAVLAIGGLGGSGTRVIAHALRRAGFFIGADLNGAEDNLWFTLLFKRDGLLSWDDHELEEWIDIFLRRMEGRLQLDERTTALISSLAQERPRHTRSWLEARVQSFLSGAGHADRRRWGWKEPNTHLIASTILRLRPDIKFIHVTRHGLDMAHSSNQNQARLWGSTILGRPYEDSPRFHLRYWCAITRRAHSLRNGWPDRVLLLDYDALCREPMVEFARLADFADHPLGGELLGEITALVRPPQDPPRWMTGGLALFDPQDVAFVQECGYSVGG